MIMTLREVCEAYGVTRRVVQGYEKAGLVAPSGHNERGYLLYDEDRQKQIKYIRQLQNLGFSILEIRHILVMSAEEKRKILGGQIQKLRTQQKELNKLIKIAEEMIEEIC